VVDQANANPARSYFPGSSLTTSDFVVDFKPELMVEIFYSGRFFMNSTIKKLLVVVSVALFLLYVALTG